MSTAQQPPSRRRRRPPALTSPSSGYSAAEWERDFRDDMKDSILMLTETVQKMTVMLELHGKRIEALEAEPKEQRAIVSTNSARNSMYIMLGAFISSVIAYVLQHGSFHP
jgi:hypothetical protein